MQDTLEILTTSTSEEDSVVHYGVRGMKWGHRKEQARLAGMSHRQYKKQIKADNKMAYKLGRDATIADRLLEYTNKKSNKIINKASKRGNEKKMKVAYTNKLKAERRAEAARAAIKQHHASLIKKYGGVYVSNIKKDKKGRINERVGSSKSNLVNGFKSAIGTVALNLIPGFSGMYIQYSKGKNQLAREAYRRMNIETIRELKKKS